MLQIILIKAKKIAVKQDKWSEKIVMISTHCAFCEQSIDT